MADNNVSARVRADNRPLRTLPDRDRMTVGQAYAPRIELVVGRDGYSGGLTLTAYMPPQPGQPHARVLFTHRWVDAPQSIEECLLVAYRGICAYMHEASIAFE